MATASAPKLGAGEAVTLSDEAFGEPWNEHLVWHVVRNELLHRRQGTHATRTRGMVRGGGAKPWRQKGTGRARQGTRTAPQWSGGGVVFGPSPRNYGGKVNRKERTKAFYAALSLHQNRGSMAVLADDAFDTPSTKRAVELRNSWDFASRDRKLLVVCTLDQEVVWRSFRNLPEVQVVAINELEVADLMWGRGLVVTESALAVLEGRDA